MKGIVLAGGSGTRLRPLTDAVPKPLLPVYDKPMIYYPMSLLMKAGIRDITIITTERDTETFRFLFGNGEDLGIDIKYAIQKEPNGIAESFLIAEDNIKGSDVALALGDNILYGPDVAEHLNHAANVTLATGHASIFGYHVDDPKAFGVVETDAYGKPVSIEEKPSRPKSDLAVIGIYFYDERVLDIAKSLKPSKRGELEITDINLAYLEYGDIELERLSNNATWFDAGTFSDLASATKAIAERERTTGTIESCPEEIAFRNGWIDKEKLAEIAYGMQNSNYGKYITNLVNGI